MIISWCKCSSVLGQQILQQMDWEMKNELLSLVIRFKLFWFFFIENMWKNKIYEEQTDDVEI